MPHGYAEDQLVEQPAITLFSELGWQTMSAMEAFGFAEPSPQPSPKGRGSVFLGRETSDEVVPPPLLRTVLLLLPFLAIMTWLATRGTYG